MLLIIKFCPQFLYVKMKFSKQKQLFFTSCLLLFEKIKIFYDNLSYGYSKFDIPTHFNNSSQVPTKIKNKQNIKLEAQV